MKLEKKSAAMIMSLLYFLQLQELARQYKAAS
jgi:hypothetical protein